MPVLLQVSGCFRYFEGGLCSVYLMDLSPDSFIFIILIKKSGDTNKVQGSWDSIHVMQVKEMGQGLKVSYKLISTVMLWLRVSHNCKM